MKFWEKVAAFVGPDRGRLTRIASLANYPQSRFSKLVKGQDCAWFTKIHDLITLMDCDFEYLMDETKDWPPGRQSHAVIKLTNEEAELVQWIRNRGPEMSIETVWNRLLVLDQSRVVTDRAEPPAPESKNVRKRSGT